MTPAPPQVASAAGPAADLCPALPGAVPGVGAGGRGDGAASGPNHQGIQLFNTHSIQIMSQIMLKFPTSFLIPSQSIKYKDNFKSEESAVFVNTG